MLLRYSEYSESLLCRPTEGNEDIEASVKAIIDEVRKGGDKALLDLSERFDGSRPSSLFVSEEEMEEAGRMIPAKLRDAIDRARDNIHAIIKLLVDDVNKRLADKEIRIELTENAKQIVVEGGYDPTYGARPLKRYLQKNVETLAAKLILEGNVGTGDTILIDGVDGHLDARIKQHLQEI